MSHRLMTRRDFIQKSAGAGALLAAAFVGVGCSSESGSQSGSGQQSSGEVVVISWGDPKRVKLMGDAFKEETGITLRYVPGANDADFYTKVKAGGGAQYDVVIANVGMAPIYERDDLVEPFDVAQLSNHGEIYPEFLRDPRFRYLKDSGRSLVFPSQWGVYGMTYNHKVLNLAEPISWEEMWKVAKGKVVLNGNYVTNLALAGRLLGLSWDEAFAMDEGPDLDKAVERMRDLKPFLLPESDDVAREQFRNENILIGMRYSLGFAYTINQLVGEDLFSSVTPKEGVIGALDGGMLVKGARNRDNALEFINFNAGKRNQLIYWDAYRGPSANKAATEAILAKGGKEAALLKSQGGHQPEVAAAMVQIRPPDHPEAWNTAWDRVLA